MVGDNKQDFFAVMLYFYMIFCINVMSEDYPEKVRLPFIEHGIHINSPTVVKFNL